MGKPTSSWLRQRRSRLPASLQPRQLPRRRPGTRTMLTRRTKETTSLKAREFLTPERRLTLQERNGTTNATVREARLDETTMERGEGADVAEDVAEILCFSAFL